MWQVLQQIAQVKTKMTKPQHKATHADNSYYFLWEVKMQNI